MVGIVFERLQYRLDYYYLTCDSSDAFLYLHFKMC